MRLTSSQAVTSWYSILRWLRGRWPDTVQFMMLPSLRSSSIALLSSLPFDVFQAIPRIRMVRKRALRNVTHGADHIQRVNQALESFESAQKTNDSVDFQPLLLSELNASRTQGYPLSRDFLVADGVADIFAGTDTTSTTLTFTLLEVFSNKEIYDVLHRELKDAIPNAFNIAPLSKLESLPYLSACIKVSHRFLMLLFTHVQ